MGWREIRMGEREIDREREKERERLSRRDFAGGHSVIETWSAFALKNVSCKPAYSR
jgi:hypothetical protein